MNARVSTPRVLWLGCVGLVLCVLGAACAAPKILTQHQYVGQRSVKYMLQRAGPQTGDVAKTLITRKSEPEKFHFWVRVCSVDKNGDEQSCRDTLVVEYVLPESVY
jgi:hypothetical protein